MTDPREALSAEVLRLLELVHAWRDADWMLEHPPAGPWDGEDDPLHRAAYKRRNDAWAVLIAEFRALLSPSEPAPTTLPEIKARVRAARYELAIRWALGEANEPDFPTREPGDPPYWWRTKLRELAFGDAPSEPSASTSGLPEWLRANTLKLYESRAAMVMKMCASAEGDRPPCGDERCFNCGTAIMLRAAGRKLYGTSSEGATPPTDAWEAERVVLDFQYAVETMVEQRCQRISRIPTDEATAAFFASRARLSALLSSIPAEPTKLSNHTLPEGSPNGSEAEGLHEGSREHRERGDDGHPEEARPTGVAVGAEVVAPREHEAAGGGGDRGAREAVGAVEADGRPAEEGGPVSSLVVPSLALGGEHRTTGYPMIDGFSSGDLVGYANIITDASAFRSIEDCARAVLAEVVRSGDERLAPTLDVEKVADVAAMALAEFWWRGRPAQFSDEDGAVHRRTAWDELSDGEKVALAEERDVAGLTIAQAVVSAYAKGALNRE